MMFFQISIINKVRRTIDLFLFHDKKNTYPVLLIWRIIKLLNILSSFIALNAEGMKSFLNVSVKTVFLIRNKKNTLLQLSHSSAHCCNLGTAQLILVMKLDLTLMIMCSFLASCHQKLAIARDEEWQLSTKQWNRRTWTKLFFFYHWFNSCRRLFVFLSSCLTNQRVNDIRDIWKKDLLENWIVYKCIVLFI